jgi:glucosamine-6-phosphate deaminase
LDHITRVDASSDFNGTANVPKIAITMGFPLFCCRRELFCWLGGKIKDIIKEQFRKTSAKFRYVLQNHANTTFVQSAASELTRFKTPWLVGDCIWTQKLKSKAIVWLCQRRIKQF